MKFLIPPPSPSLGLIMRKEREDIRNSKYFLHWSQPLVFLVAISPSQHFDTRHINKNHPSGER